ncbi:MAG: DUF4056 domain-containing protein [Burkholderiales bacterium]
MALLATLARHLLLSCLALTLSGCSGVPLPRMRLGSIPYPGAFNLFELGDPFELGDHQYEMFVGNGNEAEHGVIYTCKAGFLDVSHIRNTIDLAHYTQVRLEPELLAGHAHIELPTGVPSSLHVKLEYPGFWNGLDRREKARLARELSIVMGERLAYLMGIWHEALQWMGYKSSGLFAEDRSAFTYDDTMSHMVGVMVSARALRDTRHRYDVAVTIAMRQVIHELGPVSIAEANEAVELVEGKWWKNGDSLKRYLEVGLNDGTIEPWLVPGFAACSVKRPPSYSLPAMANVSGRDFSDFYTVAIEPRIGEVSWLDRVFDHTPARLDVKADLQRVMATIREEMAATMGPDLDDPNAIPTEK